MLVTEDDTPPPRRHSFDAGPLVRQPHEELLCVRRRNSAVARLTGTIELRTQPTLGTPTPQEVEVRNPDERESQHAVWGRHGNAPVGQGSVARMKASALSKISRFRKYGRLMSCKLDDSPMGATYVPIDAPQHFPALNYRPAILKSSTLVVMIILNLIIVGCLVGLKHIQTLTRSHDLPSVNLYLAVSYGPPLVGALSSALLRSTIQEVQRIYPYVSMADTHSSKRGSARAAESVAAIYFPIIGLWPLNRWGIPFFLLKATCTGLVAFKAALLQVVDSEESWTVLIHPQPANFLIACYVIHVTFLVIILAWLRKRNTGIRENWDPTCLADMISLFSHFNVRLTHIGPWVSTVRLTRALDCHRFRLGYWEVTHPSGSKTVAYGIRSTSTCFREKRFDVVEFRTKRHIPGSPYNQRPLQHRKEIALTNGVIRMAAIAACIYLISSGRATRTFTIDSYGQFNYTSDGFNLTDLLTSGNVTKIDYNYIPPNVPMLSGWNIVLRSIPIATINYIYGRLLRKDFQHRFAQPLKNMRFGPADADTTILLDYLTPQPLSVLSQSWGHSHWKVFYYATLNMLVPILQLTPVGNLTITEVTTADSSVAVCEPSLAFIATTLALLVIVLLSCALPWLDKTLYFPRGGTTLIDLWLMCCHSRFVRDPVFSRCDPLWTKASLASSLRTRYDKYLLGAIDASDGTERMGFEVAEKGRCGCITQWVGKFCKKTIEKQDIVTG
ncbi:phosphoribosylaminoimidazole-succinocarboxamide synthase [Apiospora hydei]|uniref:Phosphoribosylaminoimidazole-succinocarboxamide synthase n=1 Tax=Apiospora hydei TaxID=1337664 RepID=A0ABR1VLN6_9PEZI